MSLKAQSIIPPGIDASGNIVTSAGMVDSSASIQSPTTGFAITIANNTWTLILTPAGTLATGTITMPAAPANKMVVRFSTSQAITALTVSPNSGQSISNAPTAAVPGQGFSFLYNTPTTTWLRVY